MINFEHAHEERLKSLIKSEVSEMFQEESSRLSKEIEKNLKIMKSFSKEKSKNL